MIIAHLDDADRYLSLHPTFSHAFRWLRENCNQEFSEGRKEIDGETLFAMYNVGTGNERNPSALEAHRKYIDIHYTIEGVEEIGLTSTSHCEMRKTEYSADDDYELFDDSPSSWSSVPPGMFALVYPEDAHAPVCGTGPVRKFVLKVLLEED